LPYLAFYKNSDDEGTEKILDEFVSKRADFENKHFKKERIQKM
jgi:hypothetical protein